MEKVYRLQLVLALVLLTSCSSRPILEEENGQFADIRKEYESVVKIKDVPITPTLAPMQPAVPANTPQIESPKTVKPVAVTKKERRRMNKDDKNAVINGFIGRRPVSDPFVPGESVELLVSYLNMSAGVITLKVEPFKEVNGGRAYHFKVNVESKSAFSMIYSVSNWAETFMDFATMTPISLTMDQNESARLVESRVFFDSKKLEASLWEKQVSKKRGEKKKELHWTILPFSQNAISSLFFLRAFDLKPGSNFQFPVAEDGKNYIFKGEVLRSEMIKTEIGELDTLVIKPEFTLEGSLKPTGENLIWVTNDDRKLIVRIKAKVKIGSLYADVISLKR